MVSVIWKSRGPELGEGHRSSGKWGTGQKGGGEGTLSVRNLVGPCFTGGLILVLWLQLHGVTTELLRVE